MSAIEAAKRLLTIDPGVWINEMAPGREMQLAGWIESPSCAFGVIVKEAADPADLCHEDGALRLPIWAEINAVAGEYRFPAMLLVLEEGSQLRIHGCVQPPQAADSVAQSQERPKLARLAEGSIAAMLAAVRRWHESQPTEPSYWEVIDPIWEHTSIHDGPVVYMRDIQRLSPMERHLYTMHWLDSEVCNGGFHQFFYNPTGVVAPEAAAGFQALGLEPVADLIHEAMAFFGPNYPRDQEVRCLKLEAYNNAGSEEPWNPFVSANERYYDLVPEFAVAADAYVSAHRSAS